MSIRDFTILSALISKCHFTFSIHAFVCCGIQACNECVHRTLIIPIRMEMQWLHDGNLEEGKKQKLEFFKHVWGWGNRIFNSVPLSAVWKPSTLFTKIVLYLYVHI